MPQTEGQKASSPRVDPATVACLCRRSSQAKSHGRVLRSSPMTKRGGLPMPAVILPPELAPAATLQRSTNFRHQKTGRGIAPGRPCAGAAPRR